MAHERGPGSEEVLRLLPPPLLRGKSRGSLLFRGVRGAGNRLDSTEATAMTDSMCVFAGGPRPIVRAETSSGFT